jgi:phage shock protein C
MFCTKCGAETGDRARFCAQCGTATGRGGLQEPSTTYNRLSRPRYDRKVAGVCSGLARYLGIDVTLARILTVVLAIWPVGLGVILYIVCWIVMPNDPWQIPAPQVPVTSPQ